MQWFVRQALHACVYVILLWYVSAQTPANVATWVKMTNVGGTTGTAGTQGTLPTAVCDHAQVTMTQPMRALLVAKGIIPSGATEGVVTWGGGNDQTESFYENQSVWLGYRSGETEITWVVLADYVDDPLVWPALRAGHAMSATSRGDLYLFSGSLSHEFVDDLWLFNMTTLRWLCMYPGSELGINGPGAIGRGWTQLTPLYGAPLLHFNATLPLNVNGDTDTYFVHNGVGAYDGNTDGNYSKDFDDNWILQLSYDASGRPIYGWQKTDDDSGCLNAIVTCRDSLAPSSRDGMITTLSELVEALASAKVRPSEFAAAVTDLAQQATTLTNRANVVLNTWTNTGPHVDDDNLCVQQCTDAIRPPGFPPRTEGHRSAQIGPHVFSFGGYSCVVAGEQTRGGVGCYQNSMYVFDVRTYLWLTLDQPDTSDPAITPVQLAQAALWPPRSGYHTMTLLGTKLYVVGGGYEDGFSVFTFYNEVHVFNTASWLWESILIQGEAPRRGWSSAASLVSGNIWYSFGCTSFAWYDDVHILLVNQVIESRNIDAYDFKNTTAGAVSSFELQTRDFIMVNNRVSFGPELVWGVGLAALFDVRIVGIGNLDNPSSYLTQGLSLGTGTVTEDVDGGGLYHVDFTASFGHTLQIYLSFNNQAIPGSPFSVSMLPQAPDYRLSYVTSAIAAVRNDVSPLSVQVTDEFGNEVYSGGLGANFSVSIHDESMPGNDVDSPTSYITTDFENGTYQIEYRAPDANTFFLHVRISGQDILGSPFEMEGLDGLGVSQSARNGIVAVTIICMVIVFGLMCAVAYFRHGEALKVATPLFVEFMLTGSFIGLSSVLALASESDAACRAFPFLLGLGFVILLGSLYIKTYRLMVIFKQKTLRVVKLTLKKMTQIMAALLAVELLYNVLWVAIAPAHLAVVYGSPPPLTYGRCDGDHFVLWAGLSFGYKGVFLFYGVFLAFMTRGLPSAYNESGWIGLSIYNIAFVSLVVLPVIYGLSSQDTLTAVFVITCLAIIWVVMASSCALVLPKLYYIARGILPDKRLVPGSNDSSDPEAKKAAREARKAARAAARAAGETSGTHDPSSPKSGSEHEMQGGLMMNLNIPDKFGDASEEETAGDSTQVSQRTTTTTQSSQAPRAVVQPSAPAVREERVLTDIVVSGTPTTVRTENVLIAAVRDKPAFSSTQKSKNTVMSLSM